MVQHLAGTTARGQDTLQLVDRGKVTLPGFVIHRVHTGLADAHRQLMIGEGGNRSIADPQHVRAAEIVDPDGFYCLHNDPFTLPPARRGARPIGA